jgi:threonine aldolase
MDAVRTVAKKHNLPIHLDGARIFNAAAALGCEGSAIASRADSVMFCLSKGLCAPVGSLLAGTKDFVKEARFKRKIMGGGMRQAGILAAAGIIALTEQRSHLARDHERAKKMAQSLAKIPGLSIKPEDTEINMVFFNWPAAADAAEGERITSLFKKRGILINGPETDGTFRFVTHYWIGDKELDTILEVSGEAFTGPKSAEAAKGRVQ